MDHPPEYSRFEPPPGLLVDLDSEGPIRPSSLPYWFNVDRNSCWKQEFCQELSHVLFEFDSYNHDLLSALSLSANCSNSRLVMNIFKWFCFVKV